jgi:hypothetical protein
MRQSRLVLMAVGGVLLLCVLALIVSLADYTSTPAVANAHVPPVVGTPGSDTSSQAPSPAPTIAITSAPAPPAATAFPALPADTAPQPQPAGPQRVRTQTDQQPTLAQLLQQLQQGRHHRVPQG